jgi:hypothetical protein
MNYKFCIPILKYVQYYSDIFNAIYINSLENDVSDIYKLLALIGTNVLSTFVSVENSFSVLKHKEFRSKFHNGSYTIMWFDKYTKRKILDKEVARKHLFKFL